MSEVLQWAINIGLVAIGLSILLCAVRLLNGPTTTDRILAIDTLYMNAIAMLILFGMLWNTNLLIEGAILVAVLGFVSTVALARYLTRGDVVE